jgi:hypothetical protein
MLDAKVSHKNWVTKPVILKISDIIFRDTVSSVHSIQQGKTANKASRAAKLLSVPDCT